MEERIKICNKNIINNNNQAIFFFKITGMYENVNVLIYVCSKTELTSQLNYRITILHALLVLLPYFTPLCIFLIISCHYIKYSIVSTFHTFIY